MPIQGLTCQSCVDTGEMGGLATVLGKASACGHETSSRGYAYCIACSITKRACQFCGADMPHDAKPALLLPTRRAAKITPLRRSSERKAPHKKK